MPTTTRDAPLEENYELLESMGLNIPHYLSLTDESLEKKLKNYEESEDTSGQVGLRFDHPPREVTPKKFYSTVEEKTPDSIYSEPPDRELDKWIKNPHLIGDYEGIRDLLLDLSEVSRYSACMDYEVGEPHYFKTQDGCFNVHVRDSGLVLEGSVGQKTQRSDKAPDFSLSFGYEEDIHDLFPKTVDSGFADSVASYVEKLEMLCEELGAEDLIFENSHHQVKSGKKERNVVTWDILGGGGKRGKESLHGLRKSFLKED